MPTQNQINAGFNVAYKDAETMIKSMVPGFMQSSVLTALNQHQPQLKQAVTDILSAAEKAK